LIPIFGFFGKRLAAGLGRDYVFAKASIAPTNIVPVRIMAMRPYYRASNYAMKNSVGYLMKMAVNRVLPQMEALFQDQELSFSQWHTLVALHDGRISTAGDLARNICHDAGSLTRLIDQMEKRGLVTRQRSESDRRVVTLTLTQRGRALVEALAPQVMNFWNKLLSGFSHQEIDTLIALLTRLAIAADNGKRGASILRLSAVPVITPRKKAS
jgi:DNA-binding MarR family transcriptional regulator